MTDQLSQARETDTSVARRIADALAERIVLGRMQPGEKVRQDHIAVEFAASHVPVREAFRKLEARGLLVSEPRRGVRVAPIAPEAVREVVAMRAALEVLALRHAGPCLTEADLEIARAAIAEGKASMDLMVWEAANRRFHRAITSPCGMPRLTAAIEDLHQASARFVLAIWRDLAWEPRSDSDHHLIIEQLEMGDLTAAERTLEKHILDAGDALLRRLGGL